MVSGQGITGCKVGCEPFRVTVTVLACRRGILVYSYLKKNKEIEDLKIKQDHQVLLLKPMHLTKSLSQVEFVLDILALSMFVPCFVVLVRGALYYCMSVNFQLFPRHSSMFVI